MVTGGRYPNRCPLAVYYSPSRLCSVPFTFGGLALPWVVPLAPGTPGIYSLLANEIQVMLQIRGGISSTGRAAHRFGIPGIPNTRATDVPERNPSPHNWSFLRQPGMAPGIPGRGLPEGLSGNP